MSGVTDIGAKDAGSFDGCYSSADVWILVMLWVFGKLDGRLSGFTGV